MSERDNQSRVGAKPVQIVQQRLYSGGAQTRGHVRDHPRGTSGILRERVGNTRFLRQIVGAIGEQARVRIRIRQREKERLERLG